MNRERSIYEIHDIQNLKTLRFFYDCEELFTDDRSITITEAFQFFKNLFLFF